jgi:ATP-dependent Lhr-like helicase
MLRTVRTVIVDEIHAVIGSGAEPSGAQPRAPAEGRDGRLLRLGLSATQKPIEEVARFLVGNGRDRPGRPGTVRDRDEGHRRDMDLDLELPGSPLEAVMSHEVWEEYYDRLTTLIGRTAHDCVS